MSSGQEKLKELLDGLGGTEVHELCIDALRRWFKTTNRWDFDLYGDLAHELVPVLFKRKNMSEEGRLADTFVASLHLPWMGAVLDSIWWMVRAGLAIPLGISDGNLPQRFHVTRAGARFLQATDDHPLLPGFVDRMRARCPGLTDDVVALFVDARACFEHGLMRPAVALVGVGYETAIEEVAESLVSNHGVAPPVPSRAAPRLAKVRSAIATRFPGGDGPAIEFRSAAQVACDFGDELRRRRNDASHTSPRYGFDDRQEVEELLVSAGRHLPNLWAMT